MDEPSKLKLEDGRILDYKVGGDTQGSISLIFFHGTPGAYVLSPSFETACAKEGIKTIGFSRPGYGSSTRVPGRKVASVARDVDALVAHLKLDGYMAVGLGGGGPHALACAALSQKCLAAAVLSGPAPFRASGLEWLAGIESSIAAQYLAALRGKEALQAFCTERRSKILEGLAADRSALVSAMSSASPPADKKTLSRPEMVPWLADSFNEAFKTSADGWVDDTLCLVTDWDFKVSEIKVPVFIWHGSEDNQIPFTHGEWLARNISRKYVVGHLVPGEGHLFTMFGHDAAIIQDLLSVVDAAELLSQHK